MIFKYKKQTDPVGTWIRRVTPNLSPEQLVSLFEQTFAVLWKRARITFSGIMLSAVLDRVVLNCTENHPLLSKLIIHETGIKFDELHKSGRSLKESQLVEAFQSMITEFISILGNLTNGIVTPTLYSELSGVKLEPKLKILPRMNGEKT